MNTAHAEQVQTPPQPETVEVLSFYVEGIPIPQGSKKGFSRMGSTHVQIVDDNAAKLKPWRNTVRLAAYDALAGRTGFSEGVSVFLDFDLPRPKSVRRLKPHVKPDLDKLQRAILDALTDAKVWGDDGQVLTIHAVKRYADDKPGVRIKIRELA